VEPTTLLADWLAVLVVGFFAVAIPGPDFAVTVRNSLVYSRRGAMFTVVGIAMGFTVHIAYSLVGVGVLIAQSPAVYDVIKWLGAGYLIYLGLRSFWSSRSGPQVPQMNSPRVISAWSAWRMGFLTNVLNPKAPPFFLALYTQVIHPGTPITYQLLFGLTVILVGWGWFSLVVVMASHHRVAQPLSSLTHWLERVIGVVFIALGLRLVFGRVG